MNHELCLLGSLLTIQDKESLYKRILENPYSADIFTTYRSHYDYIVKHWEKYGVFPDMSTFGAEYAAEVPTLTEPPMYYLDQAIDKHKLRVLLEYDELYRKKLSTYDINGATAAMKEGLSIIEKGGAVSRDVNVASTLENRLSWYDTLRGPNPIKGLPTGWGWLDNNTGGFVDDDYAIIYGPAKTFKTYVLIDWGIHIWKTRNIRIGIVTREMTARSLCRRIDAKLANVTVDSIRKGTMTDDEFNAFSYRLKANMPQGEFASPFVVIDLSGNDGKVPEVDYLMQKAVELNLDMLMVDGIYLFNAPGDSDWQRQMNVSRKIRQGQLLAIQKLGHGMPVIATTQAAEQRDGNKQLKTAFSTQIKQDVTYMFALERVYDKVAEEFGNILKISIPVSRETDNFHGTMEITDTLGFKESGVTLDGTYAVGDEAPSNAADSVVDPYAPKF